MILSRLGVRAAVGLVRAYQVVLSPWLGRTCRHAPSCSAYAIGALRRFGLLRGGWLTARRIARCHPWGTSGYDPVPDVHDPVPATRDPESATRDPESGARDSVTAAPDRVPAAHNPLPGAHDPGHPGRPL